MLIREASKLVGIPGVLIHGRNDLGGGACTPWELARAWPGAELIIIEDSGHTGSTTMTDQPAADSRTRREPRPPQGTSRTPPVTGSGNPAGARHAARP